MSLDRSRHRIAAAARRHFMAHGFRGVTMDDLAAELAMSKKTLYAHFPSKAALLEAVLDDKMRQADADLAQATSVAPADFLAALRALLACLRRHTEELQPPFLRDMAREAPELFASVQTRRRALIARHFGKLLEDGRKAGMIRNDLPVALTLEILIGAADSIVTPQKLAALKLSAHAGLSAIISVFLEGVLTPQGRQR